MKNRKRDKRATVCPVCLQAEKSGCKTKRKKHGDDRASFDERVMGIEPT